MNDKIYTQNTEHRLQIDKTTSSSLISTDETHTQLECYLKENVGHKRTRFKFIISIFEYTYCCIHFIDR